MKRHGLSEYWHSVRSPYERNRAIDRLSDVVFTQEHGEFVARMIVENTANGREHVNTVMVSIAAERINRTNQIEYVPTEFPDKIVMYAICSRARLRNCEYNLFENIHGFLKYCDSNWMATRVITWCDLTSEEADQLLLPLFAFVNTHPVLFTIETFLYCQLRVSQPLELNRILPILHALMIEFGEKSDSMAIRQVRLFLSCAYSIVRLVATNPLPALPKHSTIFGNYRFLSLALEGGSASAETHTQLILDTTLKMVAWIDMHYTNDIVNRYVNDIERITHMPIGTHLCMRHKEFEDKIVLPETIYLVDASDDVADVTTLRVIDYDSDKETTKVNDMINNAMAAQDIWATQDEEEEEVEWRPKRARPGTQYYDT
jgi:hypothetical protein